MAAGAVESGYQGIVEIDDNEILELQSASCTRTVVDISGHSCRGNAQHKAGAADASGQITVLHNSTDATGQQTLSAGQLVKLVLWPAGDAVASGLKGRTSVGNGMDDKVLITSDGIEFEKDGLVGATYDWVGPMLTSTAPAV